MKITGIDITDYQQFKDIKFNFTYPDDFHIVEKRGKPLDKVCFIGQSGTGKTTLLEMIKMGAFNLDTPIINSLKEKYKVNILNNDMSFSRHMFLYISDNTTENSIDSLQNIFEINSKEITNLDDLLGAKIGNSDYDTNGKIFVFLDDQTTVKKIWQEIQNEIVSYSLKFQNEVTKLLNHSMQYEKFGWDVMEWKKNNIDPKDYIAEHCLNPILNKFFLEIDIDNTTTPLAIKRLNKLGTILPNKLSTGTKQILSTAIPIFKLDTNGTVILFDEPERSLFPDLQREIIDYYVSLAPDAQFFFATHSPIIAAAFEPCERFILYFDEDGNVKYKNGTAPIGDDPNDILSEDFEMMPLINKKGIEKYEEYRNLATQIINEKDETKKEKLISERMKLGNLYNF